MKIFISILLLLLISCNLPPQESFEDSINRTLSTWIGNNVNDLIAQLGPPTQKDSDNQGGWIYSYTNTNEQTRPGRYVRNWDGSVTYIPPYTNRITVVCMFWVNQNNIIYKTKAVMR